MRLIILHKTHKVNIFERKVLTKNSRNDILNSQSQIRRWTMCLIKTKKL
uniref:Uncharacterized protein n=1 Tax=Siphoviridae sp. ctX926 TaxID=2826366 RepID=A0A8S5M0Y3_9CAUD|nr:MAG TPA: hypothetical protein [Siphoviridae sp. ctX926]